MIIIAITTDGCLIQATTGEVREILNAVTGTKPEKLSIGQKIPAIDYASTITKIKSLGSDYDFEQLIRHTAGFTKSFNILQDAVAKASEITI